MSHQGRLPRVIAFTMAAAFAVVAGSMAMGSFADYFVISDEMANIAPDSARNDEAVAALKAVSRRNALLIAAVWGGTVAGLFGIAAGLTDGRISRICSRLFLGLILGSGLGALSVDVGARLSASVVNETVDTDSAVEHQDSQVMLRTVLEQLCLVAAIGVAAGLAVIIPARSPKRYFTVLVAILTAAVLAVAIFQAMSAVLLPIAPFDEVIPSLNTQQWLLAACTAVMLALALARTSSHSSHFDSQGKSVAGD